MDPEPTHTHSVQEYLSVGLPVIYGSGCIITLASLYFICLLCSVQQLASALMQSKRRKNTSKIIFLLLLSLFLFARTFLLVVPLPISSFVVFQLVGVEIPVFILFVTWQTLALWFSNSFRSSKVQSNMPCRRFLFAFFFISIFGLFIAFFIQTLISSHHQHDTGAQDYDKGKYYAAYLAFYFVQEIIPSATLLFTFMILSISSPQQPSSNQSSNHDQNNDYSSSSEQNADHTFIEYNQQQHTTYNALESTPLRALPHQQTRSNSQQQQQNSHHNSIKQSKRSQKQPYNYNSSKQPHDQDQEDTNGSTTSKGTTISSSDSGTDFYYDSVSAYQQFLNLYQFSENIEGFIYPDMVDEQSLAKDVELDEEGEKERHRKRRKPHKISSSSHSKSGKSHRKRVQEDL
ncbi:MAG: hypothetical protein EZS28_003953 [Streblomastix strix]|uniref:Uncharacterized protein n=1 Tax=Streblomastix strix TaxID=222440 RepID=A0A5J4WZG8_9EUKA|nr:MAG: hypothetical protein EZS28_003953 [Streblomastix strix]